MPHPIRTCVFTLIASLALLAAAATVEAAETVLSDDDLDVTHWSVTVTTPTAPVPAMSLIGLGGLLALLATVGIFTTLKTRRVA